MTDAEDLENIKQCLTRMLNTQYSMNSHKSSINENSVRPGAIKQAKNVEERQKSDLLYSLMDRRAIHLRTAHAPPSPCTASVVRVGNGSWGARNTSSGVTAAVVG